MHDNGLRLLLVGYESGNQQILHNIKKGMRIDVARRFTKDCHELGIAIHGTFILGLPGETKETIEETIDFAKEINPHTIQVSLAAPYPGTFLYKQALENGWLDDANAELVNDDGMQIAPLHYPHLSHTEIFDSVEDFYKRSISARQDRLDRRRDGAQPGDDEAPAARRRRVLPLPARAARTRALKHLIVTADDFGLAPEVNEAVEQAHRGRHPHRGEPDGRRRRRRPTPWSARAAAEAARRAASGAGRRRAGAAGRGIPDLVDARRARCAPIMARYGAAIFVRGRPCAGSCAPRSARSSRPFARPACARPRQRAQAFPSASRRLARSCRASAATSACGRCARRSSRARVLARGRTDAALARRARRRALGRSDARAGAQRRGSSSPIGSSASPGRAP